MVNYAESDDDEVIKPRVKARNPKRRKVESESEEDVFIDEQAASEVSEGLSTYPASEIY